MRVAIIHYWLVSMRGGEQVLEALCDLYPDADIFTLVCDRARISEKIGRHRIHTSIMQKIPGSTRHYKKLLPIMPFALEQFDLRSYDLILSSESGPAKGVIPPPGAIHICYCHSPMRYLWDHYHTYRAGSGRLTRLMMSLMSPWLRQWDVCTAARVDHFVANSNHVKDRIERYYRRRASVVSPPVATDRFDPADTVGDYYLCAGQLVGYKRVDIAVQACSRSGRKLIVVGEGEEMQRLKAIAGPSVTFLGRVPFETLRDLMRRCRALLFPGEEDFGITPVEVMACGRPVIAFGKGGALDTIVPGVTGLFHDSQSADSLEAVLDAFERDQDRFDGGAIRAHAMAFGADSFKHRMAGIIEQEVRRRGRRERMKGAVPGPTAVRAANDPYARHAPTARREGADARLSNA